MFSINGKFLARSINGQIRVAKEIIYELDRIVQDNEIEIVAPYSEYDMPELEHIKIIRFGKGNLHLWEQTYFLFYLIKNKRVGINILNSHPIFKPDICYVHDVLYKAHPELIKGLYGKLALVWNRIMFYSAMKKAINIVTVSKFSKEEILRFYRVDSSKIRVIYNGWQHMKRIREDESIFLKYPQIEKGKYCLAVSGITPQKNFSWVLKNAEYNQDKLYVIVGQHEGSSTMDLSMCGQKNVLYTGKLSDEEMKALMKECWLFIHPAVYEGFGMTPLEAIAAGASQVIVSNCACLPEIYIDSVFYIEPHNPNIDLDLFLEKKIEKNQMILESYSWERAAEELLSVIHNEII